MYSMTSVIEAILPSSADPMAIGLFIGILLMGWLFVYVGKLNRQVLREIQMKRETQLRVSMQNEAQI